MGVLPSGFNEQLASPEWRFGATSSSRYGCALLTVPSGASLRRGGSEGLTGAPDSGPPVVGVQRPACWDGGHPDEETSAYP